METYTIPEIIARLTETISENFLDCYETDSYDNTRFLDRELITKWRLLANNVNFISATVTDAYGVISTVQAFNSSLELAQLEILSKLLLIPDVYYATNLVDSVLCYTALRDSVLEPEFANVYLDIARVEMQKQDELLDEINQQLDIEEAEDSDATESDADSYESELETDSEAEQNNGHEQDSAPVANIRPELESAVEVAIAINSAPEQTSDTDVFNAILPPSTPELIQIFELDGFPEYIYAMDRSAWEDMDTTN